METLHGARLVTAIILLYISLLLSSLESTIVSTALVSISNEFKNYGQSNWVVITYLLTYSSFMIVYARLSDITGRKAALMTGVAFFTIGSLACGLAHTLKQLIVFRAFQGIGGAGIYSLTMVVCMEVTPKKHVGTVSGTTNLIFVIASAIGPVVGGAITSSTTWRWCFYLNVPPGAIAFVLMWFSFPEDRKKSWKLASIKESLLKVNWAGLILLLDSCILLIIPLEEGGVPTPWDSPLVISTLFVGGLSLIAFAFWQTYLAYRRVDHNLHPMLPLRVVFHRIMGACMLTSAFTGIVFTSCVVYVPQRFQIVNRLSPVDAGVKLLALLLVSAFGTFVSCQVMARVNVGAWIILFGNILQVVGLGLSSTISDATDISASEYGYQVIVGMGLGCSLGASFMLARIEVKKQDLASAIGTITQLRLLGGVIGVAICRVVQNSYLPSHFAQIVPSATISLLLSSSREIESLPAKQAAAVRRAYGGAFNLQWRILMYISLANIAFAFMTFRRHTKSVNDAEVGHDTVEDQEVQEESIGSVEGK